MRLKAQAILDRILDLRGKGAPEPAPQVRTVIADAIAADRQPNTPASRDAAAEDAMDFRYEAAAAARSVLEEDRAPAPVQAAPPQMARLRRRR